MEYEEPGEVGTVPYYRGIILIPILFPFLLLYAIPLILIGVFIILFRKREEQIEARKD